MKFVVRRVPENRIILPDTGIAFILKDRVRPISQKDDKIVEVLIPLSSDCVVIGSPFGATFRSHPTINSLLASCAYQSFAFRDDDERHLSLAKRIGKNTTLLRDDEISNLVRQT